MHAPRRSAWSGEQDLDERDLTDLTFHELRRYRHHLAEEEDKVSYWRRLAHARLDVLEAESVAQGPLSIDQLARVLGDTGSGRRRRALVRVRAAEELPELPALEQVCVHEVDRTDPAEIQAAIEGLREAESRLTSYRRALHHRIESSTAELIRRYREQPSLALEMLRVEATEAAR